MLDLKVLQEYTDYMLLYTECDIQASTLGPEGNSQWVKVPSYLDVFSMQVSANGTINGGGWDTYLHGTLDGAVHAQPNEYDNRYKNLLNHAGEQTNEFDHLEFNAHIITEAVRAPMRYIRVRVGTLQFAAPGPGVATKIFIYVLATKSGERSK